ncbi:YceI family protein [Maricaulis sp.]|uniref:YceI family protein n=1 Tax=Maricaulis sp. TaxID=1486257 RepID=UPI0025B95FDC|nr:YceI family protein [Maricaulis sp.]
MRLPVIAVLAAALAACSQPVTGADWQLDAAASHLDFVSIKAGDVAEGHSFTGLSGSVEAGGLAVLIIDLDTVETGIEIRNERMREHFFQTADFPQARVTTTLDLAALADLEVGERRPLALDAVLDLHGVSVNLEAEVMVTDIDGRNVLVESRGPVLLHTDDFGFADGLATLQELANLPSITPVAPVTFSLVFTRG